MRCIRVGREHGSCGATLGRRLVAIAPCTVEAHRAAHQLRVDLQLRRTHLLHSHLLIGLACHGLWHKGLGLGTHPLWRDDRIRVLVGRHEESSQLIDGELDVEGHVGCIESALVERLARLNDPEAVQRGSSFICDEQMVQQVVLQHELDALIKVLSSLISPTLKLTAERALVGESITVLWLLVAAVR